MGIRKFLVVPVLLMIVLSFSAFTTPQAHAATISGRVLPGANPTTCNPVTRSENDTPTYSIYLVEDLCYDQYYAEIVAHVPGTFTVTLYGDSYLLSQQTNYLNYGGYVSTPEYGGYSVYTDQGTYDG